MAYSRTWLIDHYKARVVTILEQIEELTVAGDIGVSYSLPTGHSFSNQGQLDHLRSLLEYYEARLRALRPAYQVSRGL